MNAVRRLLRLGLASAIVGLAFASAQCGLLGPPGDYANGGSDAVDASTEAAPGNDGSAPVTDAPVIPDGPVVPGSIGTITLMAGERDPTSVEDDPAWSSDAYSGLLAADGSVATWRIDKSAPIVGSFDSAGLVGTRWVMINVGFGLAGGRGTAIQATSWAPGVVGDWKAARAGGAPGGLDEYTRAFYGTHLFYIGGTRTTPGVDGGPSTTFFTNEAHVADIDPAKPSLGSSTDTGMQLVTARSRPGVVFADGHAYVVGGRSSGGVTASVEMASADVGAGTLGAFSAQPVMMTGGAEHKVFLPNLVVANGYLFVVGGRISAAGAPTEVVLSSKIAADGSLAAFETVTSLPKPLHDAAVVSFKGRLYVAGGVGAQTRSDDVYSAVIDGNGKLSAWQAHAKLPAPRSDFVALAY